jgi:hypothetical protein
MHDPVKITFRRVVFGDDGPETHAETRYLVYTMRSYRQLAEALGLDVVALVQQEGEPDADALAQAAAEADATSDLGPTEQLAVTVWAGLQYHAQQTGQPITLSEVEDLLSPSNVEYVNECVETALGRFAEAQAAPGDGSPPTGEAQGKASRPS